MAEILKEYLAGLGFQIDENKYRRFNEALATTAVGAVKLGATLSAVATEIGLGVTRVADQMESLYYASLRAGASAGNLSSLRFAARQIGIDAESASKAAENLMFTLRSQPGTESILRNLGVETRKANGDLEDGSKILVQFADKLRGVPFYIATQWAEMFGISREQLFMLQQGMDKLKEKTDQYNRSAQRAGVDQDELAKRSVEFNNALGLLSTNLALIGDRMVQNFLEPATKLILTVNDLVEAFQKWNNQLDGIPATLGTIVTSIVAVWGAARLMRGALGMLGIGAAAAGGGAAAGAGGAAAAAAGGGVAGWLARMLGRVSLIGLGGYAIYKGSELASPYQEELNKREPGKHWNPKQTQQEAEENVRRANPGLWNRLFGGGERGTGALPERPTAPAPSGGDRKRAAMQYFMNQGWTREQAAGIVANLEAESGLDPASYNSTGGGQGARGIAQWRGERQTRLREFSGTDKPSFEQQLAFIQHELNTTHKAAAKRLSESKTVDESSEAFLREFERPKAEELAMHAIKRARLATKVYREYGDVQSEPTQVTQNVTINVNGTGNPEEVARRVAEEQERTVANLQRSFAPMVR